MAQTIKPPERDTDRVTLSLTPDMRRSLEGEVQATINRLLERAYPGQALTQASLQREDVLLKKHVVMEGHYHDKDSNQRILTPVGHRTQKAAEWRDGEGRLVIERIHAPRGKYSTRWKREELVRIYDAQGHISAEVTLGFDVRGFSGHSEGTTGQPHVRAIQYFTPAKEIEIAVPPTRDAQRQRDIQRNDERALRELVKAGTKPRNAMKKLERLSPRSSTSGSIQLVHVPPRLEMEEVFSSPTLQRKRQRLTLEDRLERRTVEHADGGTTITNFGKNGTEQVYYDPSGKGTRTYKDHEGNVLREQMLSPRKKKGAAVEDRVRSDVLAEHNDNSKGGKTGRTRNRWRLLARIHNNEMDNISPSDYAPLPAHDGWKEMPVEERDEARTRLQNGSTTRGRYELGTLLPSDKERSR